MQGLICLEGSRSREFTYVFGQPGFDVGRAIAQWAGHYLYMGIYLYKAVLNAQNLDVYKKVFFTFYCIVIVGRDKLLGNSITVG